MDRKEIVKQVVDLQGAACSIMMAGVVTFWKQTEKALDLFLGHVEGLPGEGKAVMKEWAGSNTKVCMGLKSALDQGFNRLGNYFEPGKKS